MTQFQNPQHDPETEKRTLLAFAVIILFFFVSQYYMSKYAPPQQQQQAQNSAATPSPSPVMPGNSIAAAQPPPASANVKQAAAESETLVENPVYKITFTNRGAQVKSWILKNYTDDQGQPLDLVNKVAAAKYGYPISLYAYDEGLRNKLNQAMYVASATGALQASASAPQTLSFEYSDGDIAVRKTFGFDSSYVLKTEVSVTQKGSLVSTFLSWPGGFGDQTIPATYHAAHIDYAFDDKVERTPAKKVSGGNTVRGPFYWAGAGDQYFAAVFLPDDPNAAAMVEFRNDIEIPKNPSKPDPKEMDMVPVLGAAVGNLSGITRERVFAGPKNLEVLNSIHTAGGGAAPSLANLVDFGFFSIISKPTFMWLRWTYEHWTRNWGWAILILTVIINAVLLPLRLTTFRSALKMQKIQPQIEQIKKKYEHLKFNDPKKQEMSVEMMALQKREGINPLAGCIPTLLSLPFIYAFYAVLGNTIELRHAPWLWIHDLSAPDPWHVLPIFFVATMILTQKLTPAVGMDPAQQKMMMLTMPIVLGIFTWNYAAGLSLYWATSNLLQIAQQWGLNQTKLGKEMREIAAKRARKKQSR